MIATARIRSLEIVACLAMVSHHLAASNRAGLELWPGTNEIDDSLDVSDLNGLRVYLRTGHLSGLSDNLSRLLRVTLSVNFGDIGCSVTKYYLCRFKSELLSYFSSSSVP